MKEEECVILPEALDEVVRHYSDTTGIRDLEQAAEHIAANALYQIEVIMWIRLYLTQKWFGNC